MVKLFSFLLGSVCGLAGYKVAKIANKVYPYFLPDNHLPKQQKIRVKKIAVISGATDGLGKAFAKRLCQDGFKIVALTRSDSKVQAIAQQLSSLQPKRVDFLSSYKIDFSQLSLLQTKQKVHQLAQLIESQLICQGQSNFNTIQVMFVNSCGDAHISRYENTDLGQIERIHNVNMNSFHLLAKTLFQLRESKQMSRIDARKQFMFVNVSSGVDAQPNRYSSIYSGTKAYLSNLMKTITLEQNSASQKDQHQDMNMYFLNLTPLYIRTKLIRYLKDWDVVEPQQIVEGALKLIRRKEEGAGCAMHELIKEFPFVASESFNQRVEKALQVKNKFEEMQAKRKARKNSKSPE